MALQINEKKLARQLLGADKWKRANDLGLSHSNGWGTFHWETGVGKTFAAYNICNKMLNKNNACTVIITVPGEELEKQWKQKLEEYVDKKYHANFRILTIHKIMQEINNGFIYQCSLLIVDELHEFYTEERRKIFTGQYIATTWCLALTANYEDKDNRHLSIQSILPVVDRIDAEEASKEGFISRFVEYNIAIKFTEKEQEVYNHYTSIITKNLSKFGKHGLTLASKILETPEIASNYAAHNGWYQGMDLSIQSNADINAMWHPHTIIGYAKNAMDAIRERKNIVYCAMNKLKVAKDLVIKFDTLKTICFSQSTAFADILGKLINDHYKDLTLQESSQCVVYHSKLRTVITIDPTTGKEKKKGKTVLKREAIEAIRNGVARIISTASSLDRGFDVEDIRMAITTSGTQNPTQYNQRKGRALRYEEGIIVLVLNLYIKNSIDESWLRKRQSKSKSIIYFVDNIEDIHYNPKDKIMLNEVEI